MTNILNIDTAGEQAFISITRNGVTESVLTNSQMHDHAAWIHPALDQLFIKEKLNTNELHAVSVSIGPGSYTGLRVGLATAKGICFAKKIPLIAVSTLEIIAFSVKEQVKDFVCPMIDARRDEVFCAVYDKQMTLIQEPAPLVLTKNSFAGLLSNHTVLFCGNGSKKLQSYIEFAPIVIASSQIQGTEQGTIAYKQFLRKEFADLAYAEPAYLKAFYQAGR